MLIVGGKGFWREAVSWIPHYGKESRGSVLDF